MSWKKKLAGVFGSLIAAALIASPARAADMEIGPDRALKLKSDGPTSIAAATSRSGASTVRSDRAREVDIERVHRQMIEEVVDRIERQSGSAATTAAPLAVPALRGLPVDDESNGVSGFAGLIGFDQATAGSNVFDFEPPDQALCVGNGFVVEGVNLALAIYSPQGKLLAGPASLNDFFGLADELTDPRNLSDPRCLYDAGSNRWFVTLTQFELDAVGNITGSQLRIAVSHGGDPTGGYQLYSLETSNDGSDFFPGDCPCLGDQPLIGADANGFYLSTNSFGQTSFQGAQLYLLSKADLAANSAVVHGFHVGHLSGAVNALFPKRGEFSFSIQPSATTPGDPGDPGNEYFVQSLRAHRLENALVVFAVGNTAALNPGHGVPSLRIRRVDTENYARPVAVSQRAGPTPLGDFEVRALQQMDGDDQRLQQVTLRKGRLWTTLGTSVHTDGEPLRSGAAFFALDVKNPATGLQATVHRQGYVAGQPNTFLTYPAVGVNAAGKVEMVFTVAGVGEFPSAAVWPLGGEAIHIVSEGAAPEDGFSAYLFARPRWGDYSAVAADRDGSIWMATEFIPGPRDFFTNWGTFVARASADGEGNDD